MKEGRSVQMVIEEVMKQVETKKDFMAPTSRMEVFIDSMVGGENEIKLGLHSSGDTVRFGMKQNAHRNLGSLTQIPASYYDKMMSEDPELLVTNLNRWLPRLNDTRMVRTLEGKARAILSKSYRPLDNADLAKAVLPVVAQTNLKIQSCEVTDDRFYLKATNPAIRAEVKGSKQVGDIVEAGIVVSNSEVGMGAVSIQPLVFRLVCKNGAIMNDRALRKYHTGKRGSAEITDVSYELLRDETKAKLDEAFWMQVQDLVRAAVDGVLFNEQVKIMEKAAGNLITGNVEKVVEMTTKKYQLQEKEGVSILDYLAKGGDLSQWGLANAVTRASQDIESYDRATDLERMGGKLIELPEVEWVQIANARTV